MYVAFFYCKMNKHILDSVWVEEVVFLWETFESTTKAAELKKVFSQVFYNHCKPCFLNINAGISCMKLNFNIVLK